MTVPTVLMAVTDENLTELPGDMPAVLAGRGLRMPTPDEWEHACGAGADTTAVHGGDGGESVCGGYGHLLAWLPLATANRNPNMAEFVYGPEGEDLCEDFSTRPVLTL
ncbi:hypothetical protein [Nonomuraea rubra]|uniref:hypothetical protein n=1 Tax=Nonomuraea rubra TaxID=46180 RepID=UPI0033E82D7B